MMVKQGGVSWNRNSSKKGLSTKFKCPICDRQYKQQHTMETHHKKCLKKNGNNRKS